MELADRFTRAFVIHFNKSETAWAPGFPVCYHVHGIDIPEIREKAAELTFVHTKRHVSNIDFHNYFFPYPSKRMCCHECSDYCASVKRFARVIRAAENLGLFGQDSYKKITSVYAFCESGPWVRVFGCQYII